jgi:hypothetical protein
VVARAFTAEIICEYCFGKQYGFFENLTGAQELLVDIYRPGDLKYVHHIGKFSRILQKVITTTQIVAYALRKKLGLKTNGGFAAFFVVKVNGLLKGDIH